MQAGWIFITPEESVNLENMVKVEVGVTRVCMDLNLPYHAYINEKASGAGRPNKNIRTRRDET